MSTGSARLTRKTLRLNGSRAGGHAARLTPGHPPELEEALGAVLTGAGPS